jgi:hypothetical protein
MDPAVLPPEQEFLLVTQKKTGTPLSAPYTTDSGSTLLNPQARAISF